MQLRAHKCAHLISWQGWLVSNVVCVQWLFAECDADDAHTALGLQGVQALLLQNTQLIIN